MTTLGELTEAAGPALLAVGPFDPARQITGVHVSELADPGRYLDGGELLLTTGIRLTGRDDDDAYVARLAEQRLGALGLGLGEGWDAVPPGFAERCTNAGVPLFVVPDGEPFLSVTRSFWQLAGRGEREAVARVGHTHTRLAEAAAGADPVREVVRLTSEAIGGWAAWVPLDQASPSALLHPAGLSGLLPAVKADVERSLERTGVAAASFVAHGSVVVAHPVVANSRTLGAVAVGASRPLTRTDRQLVLTAVAVLRLALRRPGPVTSAARWVAQLVFEGDATAARSLARSAGVELPLLSRVHVGGADDAPIGDLVIERDGVRLTLVDAESATDGRGGALSAAVALEEVPIAAARAFAFWRRSPDQAVVDSAERAEDWVRLLDGSPVLLATTRAHLASGRHAEHTARALGVHRNTVRQRIAAAEQLLGVDLADPDVSAELWLALRRRP
ncbi:PucR family transcriptional regulator [Microbacterium sp. HD4P20]|uniref:PucR family transcriptional regulator n=1 Tax=Microbacterium sp. HD4P20 TaxID=2864874 RepID=UPI0020A28F7F|nr:PucR family transcriptional regulator [Microbacterium sp. HD4P20]MCP2635180.1 PucR family transcriptional regulator [Microbacterium sp. HD4P20]